MAKHGQTAQSAMCWYAETSDDGCSIRRHHFPENQVFLIDGIDGMGPDTAALVRDSLTAANRLLRGSTIALDAWAWETIGMAAASFPNFVGHLTMAVMLRADKTRNVRSFGNPGPWAGSLRSRCRSRPFL